MLPDLPTPPWVRTVPWDNIVCANSDFIIDASLKNYVPLVNFLFSNIVIPGVAICLGVWMKKYPELLSYCDVDAPWAERVYATFALTVDSSLK